MFPLAVSTHPTPKPQANTDLLFCYHIDLSSSEFCINEVTWYTLFCLDSFTQHSVFEIHPLLHESVIGYFFFFAEWYSIVQIYHCWFNNSPNDGHLGLFQFLK